MKAAIVIATVVWLLFSVGMFAVGFQIGFEQGARQNVRCGVTAQ